MAKLVQIDGFNRWISEVDGGLVRDGLLLVTENTPLPTLYPETLSSAQLILVGPVGGFRADDGYEIPINQDRSFSLPPMASPDHLVLTPKGWKPFKDLRVGDQIVNDEGSVRIEREIPDDFLNLKRR